MRRSFIAFIIFIISGAALSAQSGDRDLRLTMKNQGYEREYRLYIPEGVGEGSPLVIALHGYGGGIEKMPSALITTAKAHGYAICIQHPGDLITIYRHNARLMKKTGDKVNAGSTIGITAKAEGTTGGGSLIFEMWHKGESVDPAKYITF